MKCIPTLVAVVSISVAASPAHGQVQQYVRRSNVDDVEQWSSGVSRDLWSWSNLFSWVCKGPLFDHKNCGSGNDDDGDGGSDNEVAEASSGNSDAAENSETVTSGTVESTSGSASAWGFLIGALLVASIAGLYAVSRRRKNNTEGGSHPLNSSVSKRMDLVSRVLGCTKVSATDVDDGDNELARRGSTKAHADYVHA